MEALTSTLSLHASSGAAILPSSLAGALTVLLAAQLAFATLFGSRRAKTDGFARAAFGSVLLGGSVGAALFIASIAGLDAPTVRLSLAGFETPHAVSLGFSFDGLAGLMVALVGFIGWVVLRFSHTYLRSEAHRHRFMRRLVATILLVELFALSTSLIGHALYWLGIGVCVHQLLRHYDERPRARLAAKKKFLISRTADLLFAASLTLLFREFGTLDVAELSERAQATPAGQFAILGVALAALMKSAQFPLHSWLPETMDAPTPVSALMHAGVVNAGALLLLRTAPLLEHTPVALALLVLVGTASAVLGTVAGSVQSSVKLQLAYSTVAQMGFLFFELGLGLTGAAALHLVAHALYKAHAFLRSGTPRKSYEPTRASEGQMLAAVLASFVVFGSLLVGSVQLWGPDAWDYLPLGIVWALSSSQYLLGPAALRVSARVRNYFLVGLSAWAFAFLGEAALGALVPAPPGWLSGGAVMPTAVLLSLLLFVSTFLLTSGRWLGSAAGGSFRIHALSGFYFGEVTDRITQTLWPDASAPSLSSTRSTVSVPPVST